MVLDLINIICIILFHYEEIMKLEESSILLMIDESCFRLLIEKSQEIIVILTWP